MGRQVVAKMREEILGQAVPLFAKVGFEGVSMRDIAATVGVTPAALYHHFSDKDELYLAAVEHAFEGKVGPFKSILDGTGSCWDRLEAFITQFARVLDKENDFRRLMQWVMLDSDEQRLQRLGHCIFGNLFNALRNVAGELDPAGSTHLLAVSIVGLVIYHFETQAVRRFLQGYDQQREAPEVIARHVVELLRNGLGASGSST
ncbi:TetR/AcrR family transcriptional regulator [Azospira sp. I09]|jgi:AcrR family transcriptional regulator|uniref:TetR/AcrR family transcriptional regulator n=1 Tax=Azospira sp. I09 TaxID=1765049 RepID=UPI0012611EFC|nr:TetR/AcrR family transcriptional regulator [Azospira sp. I09]BBN90447.1 TetR family transcriptional regulator [Azospira sp. I09]